MTLRSAEAAARRPGLFLLVAMTALGPVALTIFIPSMPGLQAALATDYASAQLTLTLYLVSLAVFQLVLGPLSDRFGRRPVLLVGIALFVLASLGCALATSVEQLILARVVQAAGGCAGMAIGRAIVRDLYARDEAASLFGLVNVGMVVGPLVAPPLGGALDEIGGWRLPFVAVALFGLVVFVLLLVQLRETNLVRERSAGFLRFARNSGTLFREPTFLGFALQTAFATCLYYAFIAGAPFVAAEEIGASARDFGFIYFFVPLGYMAGNFLTGRLGRRVGAEPLMWAGLGLALIGLAGMGGVAWLKIHTLLALFMPMTIVTISNGLVIPTGSAAAISVRPDIAGAASGVAGFLQIGFAALATLAVGLMHDGTRIPMLLVMAAAWCLGALSLIFAVWSERRAPAVDDVLNGRG